MTAQKETREWLQELYSGEGREILNRPEEEEEFGFFDPRYRDLAARTYRFRLGRERAMGGRAGNETARRARL